MDEEVLATDAGRGGTAEGVTKLERGAAVCRGFGFGVILPGVLGEIDVNRVFTGL